MLPTILLSLATAVIIPVLAIQAPLDSSQHWQDEQHPLTTDVGDQDLTEWSLHKLRSPNATDHLVFETIYSLLQHWPNTRMRNGHNVVSGIVPNGTLLYHARSDKELPPGPECISTDPEHSYSFCGHLNDPPKHGCWHLTLMTTRPLKVVYFDGSSAVKLPYSPLDTQDLIAWGRQGDDIAFCEDMRRIQDLCKWGKNFGVDGFVRMEMDFETMLCDFTAGVSVVSFENLVSGWVNGSMMPYFNVFEVIHAGSWHYHFPGETRIQLDLTGLVSFYDTQLAPSLVAVRAGQERWDHRVLNVSSEDLSAVKSRLEANLIRPDSASSGIDWKTLIQVIVDRYAQRLELTRYLLNIPATNLDKLVDLARKAQTQLRIMLTPYLLFTSTPTIQSGKAKLDWTIPIFKLCATTHTHSMESQFDSMTDSEKLVLQAVRGTSREICRVVTKMWAAGVDPMLNTRDFPDISEIARLRDTWTEELERLMNLLDWSVWVKCNPGCDREEMCFLPTWPFGFPPMKWSPCLEQPSSLDAAGPYSERWTSFELRAMLMERLAEGTWNTAKPGSDEWIRPQPKCVRRIQPYKFDGWPM